MGIDDDLIIIGHGDYATRHIVRDSFGEVEYSYEDIKEVMHLFKYMGFVRRGNETIHYYA